MKFDSMMYFQSAIMTSKQKNFFFLKVGPNDEMSDDLCMVLK